ncbi:hypothetical protein GOP47_0005711 [Adiantum capillus-veneris]|uniref:Uncharacterized protein n=1 Tax=Adiantum capillus-veneris TaxID=13818 RepID=A0A9D4V782_ADICA|nr:hypothetical protein GOP47_0005711 [Adiantum capillus-veneris]
MLGGTLMANSMLGGREASIYGLELSLESLTIELGSMRTQVGNIGTEVSSIRATVEDMAKDTRRIMEMLNEQKVKLLPEIIKILGALHMTISTEHMSHIPKFFIFEDEQSQHLICKLVPGVHKYRLRFMCESEPMPHVPKEGTGMVVTTLEEGSLSSVVMPYLQALLAALAVGMRVGAPLAQSQGIPVPDMSGLIDQLLQESRNVQVRDPSIVEDVASAKKRYHQHRAAAAKAQAWIKGFLQQKMCYGDDCNMFSLFGLRKQLLADGRWVWLCDQHSVNYQRTG